MFFYTRRYKNWSTSFSANIFFYGVWSRKRMLNANISLFLKQFCFPGRSKGHTHRLTRLVREFFIFFILAVNHFCPIPQIQNHGVFHHCIIIARAMHHKISAAFTCGSFNRLQERERRKSMC